MAFLTILSTALLSLVLSMNLLRVYSIPLSHDILMNNGIESSVHFFTEYSYRSLFLQKIKILQVQNKKITKYIVILELIKKIYGQQNFFFFFFFNMTFLCPGLSGFLPLIFSPSHSLSPTWFDSTAVQFLPSVCTIMINFLLLSFIPVPPPLSSLLLQKGVEILGWVQTWCCFLCILLYLFYKTWSCIGRNCVILSQYSN